MSRRLALISQAWSGAKKILLEHIHIERSEITETGDYDLEGLFVRLNHAIDSIGAKRVVLDTLEVLKIKSARRSGTEIAVRIPLPSEATRS